MYFNIVNGFMYLISPYVVMENANQRMAIFGNSRIEIKGN